MLLGTMIDNLVVGGPAYNSRQLHHGDVILKVDGVPVTQTNIHEVMVGSDIPGSPILLTVARGGAKVLEPCGRIPETLILSYVDRLLSC
jgi:C-terminal processing protease CtpA/Prc